MVGQHSHTSNPERGKSATISEVKTVEFDNKESDVTYRVCERIY